MKFSPSMQVQLELQSLYAEANVLAYEATKALLADSFDTPNLTVALTWAKRWEGIQDETSYC